MSSCHLEHNHQGHTALMGPSMQRQAVSIVKPTLPIVGTGLESMDRSNQWMDFEVCCLDGYMAP